MKSIPLVDYYTDNSTEYLSKKLDPEFFNYYLCFSIINYVSDQYCNFLLHVAFHCSRKFGGFMGQLDSKV